MFFKRKDCECCKLHERHIATLQDEVVYLRSLVSGPVSSDGLPTVTVDQAMDEGAKYEVPPELTPEQLEEMNEAHSLLTGNF